MACEVKRLSDHEQDSHAHHTEQLEIHPNVFARVCLIAERKEISAESRAAGGEVDVMKT
jgi:hypothetical protein